MLFEPVSVETCKVGFSNLREGQGSEFSGGCIKLDAKGESPRFTIEWLRKRKETFRQTRVV